MLGCGRARVPLRTLFVGAGLSAWRGVWFPPPLSHTQALVQGFFLPRKGFPAQIYDRKISTRPARGTPARRQGLNEARRAVDEV